MDKKEKKDKYCVYDKKSKGEFKMATQIAVTPILYGKYAKAVYEEVSKKPTERSKDNGKKLLDFFNLNIKE